MLILGHTRIASPLVLLSMGWKTAEINRVVCTNNAQFYALNIVYALFKSNTPYDGEVMFIEMKINTIGRTEWRKMGNFGQCYLPERT